AGVPPKIRTRSAASLRRVPHERTAFSPRSADGGVSAACRHRRVPADLGTRACPPRESPQLRLGIVNRCIAFEALVLRVRVRPSSRIVARSGLLPKGGGPHGLRVNL